MIPVWRRKEIRITYSMEEQDQIRETLSKSGIACEIRTKDQTAPTLFSSRGRSGTMFIRMDAAVEYKIYVDRDDYERALHELDKIGRKL